MPLAEADQNEVFAFLADARSHGGKPVRRIDTHAACVFLVGDTAYKIKRAVRFPFLDYSTLDRRKAACDSEIEVNQPFAPAIYRRVVPVTREPDDRLCIDGRGTPIEWAVEMRRFDETQTLDYLADAGRIDAMLADELGRIVAHAHATTKAVDGHQWIGSLATIISQNNDAFLSADDIFPSETVDALTTASGRALNARRGLLEARAHAGLIRRCHGDLHLGNIALIDGRPVLFDAIEFDPVIGSGDLLYDFGFLLMDLIERGLRGAANIALNRYLRETRHDTDYDALALLPLFMSLRAAIRAKVIAARRYNDDADATAIVKTARGYFALALALLNPPPPRLVAIGGLSGTGKSLLAASLAAHILPEPGAIVVRTDVERKAMFGIAETEKLPATAYCREATMSVYAIASDAARRIVAAGHAAIVDAVFSSAEERANIQAVAAMAKVPFDGLFLMASLPTRIARVGGRVADASDADETVARSQEHYEIGPFNWVAVDANGTPAATLANARKALKLA